MIKSVKVHFRSTSRQRTQTDPWPNCLGNSLFVTKRQSWKYYEITNFSQFHPFIWGIPIVQKNLFQEHVVGFDVTMKHTRSVSCFHTVQGPSNVNLGSIRHLFQSSQSKPAIVLGDPRASVTCCILPTKSILFLLAPTVVVAVVVVELSWYSFKKRSFLVIGDQHKST